MRNTLIKNHALTIRKGVGLILCAGGLLAAQAGAATKGTIPETFQGTWYDATRPCDEPGQYTVDINATGMDSGEDSSHLVSIRVFGKTHIRIVTEDYGELTGDSPPGSDAHIGRSRSELYLSDGGQKLKIVYGNGMIASLMRCPAA